MRARAAEADRAAKQSLEAKATRAPDRDSAKGGSAMQRARSNASVGTGARPRPIIVGPPDHEPGWQYLYLASELERGLADLETEYVAHEAHRAHRAHRTDTSLVPDPVSGAKAQLGVLQDLNEYPASRTE